MFTVDFDFDRSPRERSKLPVEDRAPGDESADVAVVRFDDDGGYVDPRQRGALTRHIGRVRRAPGSNGALVVLFIHGWRHDARWPGPRRGDKHFRAFRDVLSFLAGRESERKAYRQGRPLGRRVIGVYVGWDGKARRTLRGSTLGRIGLDHPAFFNRYEVALKIGHGKDVRHLLRWITQATKGRGGAPCQLILIGHSMGGLILETALRKMIERGGKTLFQDVSPDPRSPVRTTIGRSAVAFPDAVISLNSAADSEVAASLIELLERRGVQRWGEDGPVAYAPPMLVSATSSNDTATGSWWSKAMGILRAKRRMFGKSRDDTLIRDFRDDENLATIGHQPSLLRHQLTRAGVAGRARCRAKRDVLDLGQEFHCVRPPRPPKAPTPRITVALPETPRTPRNKSDKGTHTNYRLAPLPGIGTAKPQLLWNFQVPADLIPDHNDVFNFRAKALILALMQVSGTIASLAVRWRDSFER